MERPPSVTVSPETRNRVMETLDRFPALVQPPDTTDRRCYSASCECVGVCECVGCVCVWEGGVSVCVCVCVREV